MVYLTVTTAADIPTGLAEHGRQLPAMNRQTLASEIVQLG